MRTHLFEAFCSPAWALPSKTVKLGNKQWLSDSNFFSKYMFFPPSLFLEGNSLRRRHRLTVSGDVRTAQGLRVCVLACVVSEWEREGEREKVKAHVGRERARALERARHTHLCWLVIVLMSLVCLFPVAALYWPIREALTLCHHRTENRPLLNQLISPRMQMPSAPSQTHSILLYASFCCCWMHCLNLTTGLFSVFFVLCVFRLGYSLARNV